MIVLKSIYAQKKKTKTTTTITRKQQTNKWNLDNTCSLIALRIKEFKEESLISQGAVHIWCQ